MAAEPHSAWVARAFVTSALAEWGAGRSLDAVVLLTSELVTNAIQHAHSDVELIVRCDSGRVRVEVNDASDKLPIRRFPTPEQTHGRGLALVEALSASWGVDSLPRSGKSIWFEVLS